MVRINNERVGMEDIEPAGLETNSRDREAVLGSCTSNKIVVEKKPVTSKFI